MQYHYGWMPLKTAKAQEYKKAESVYQTLLLIVYRVKATHFLRNMELAANQQLKESKERVERRRRLHVLRKTFQAIRNNCREELERKEELQVQHEVHTLKVLLYRYRFI